MRKALSLALVAALALAVVGATAAAKGPDTVAVLVGFAGAPDAAVVQALGGQVNRVFDHVTALAARLPAGALEALRANPRVAYVEPDGPVYACAQTLPWGVDMIDAEKVHAQGNRGDNVKVAIVDTGIDMDHPDLAVLGGYDFVNGDSNPDDDNGHGTHMAGIGAALDNTIGVVGVAPLAHLYAVKVLSSTGAGSISNLVAGINWCINNGMKVISMSLGGTTDYATLKSACDDAYYNHGILLVAASGGAGGGPTKDTVGYPARYDSVIAVGAIDQNKVRYSPSSTGPSLELCAPGANIYSTYRGGGYYTMSGTSTACPHVAGTAALVWYAHPSYSNVTVRSRMDSTAVDLGPAGRDWEYGYGMVYCPEAVK